MPHPGHPLQTSNGSASCLETPLPPSSRNIQRSGCRSVFLCSIHTRRSFGLSSVPYYPHLPRSLKTSAPTRTLKSGNLHRLECWGPHTRAHISIHIHTHTYTYAHAQQHTLATKTLHPARHPLHDTLCTSLPICHPPHVTLRTPISAHHPLQIALCMSLYARRPPHVTPCTSLPTRRSLFAAP